MCVVGIGALSWAEAGGNSMWAMTPTPSVAVVLSKPQLCPGSTFVTQWRVGVLGGGASLVALGATCSDGSQLPAVNLTASGGFGTQYTTIAAVGGFLQLSGQLTATGLTFLQASCCPLGITIACLR